VLPAVCVAASWPASLPEEGRFRGVGIRVVHELALPAAESFDVERLGIESPWSTYGRVLGEADDLVSRLLGNPEPVQGDMQVECQFQVDSHEEETGMMWGDVGRLYFWIKEDDLASRSWDATWMILQCG
jgi:hypothetical protein